MPKPDFLETTEVALLDWSGVFSNDQKLVYEANQRLLEAHGYPRLDEEEWRNGSPAWNAGNFLAAAGRGKKTDLYNQYAEIFAQVKEEKEAPAPYADGKELLLVLGRLGIAMEVISSHPTEELEAEATRYGLRHLIHELYGSTPDKADAIQQRLQAHGIDPSQAFYLGDTVQDVQAARQAKVPAIAITHGYHSKEILAEEKPALIVSSLGELATLMQ